MIALLLLPAAGATPIVVYDLESDDGAFVESGETGQWAWGAVGNGPGSGYDGSNAWSTGLLRDYLNESTDYLEVPVPDLSGVARPMFSFLHWYDIAVGDYAWVEVDSGNGWTLATPLYGYPFEAGWSAASGGWQTAVFDLSTEGTSPRVRLAFSSDTSGVAAGWTVDNVAFHDGDVAPPRFSALDSFDDTDDLVGPYVIEAIAEDDVAVTGMTLWWTVDGVTTSAAMSPSGDGAWRGEIPAQPADTLVSYWVIATDGLNEAREPEWADESFRVYLPAPTDLVAPGGRLVDTEVSLDWEAPVSRNEVLGYEIVSGDATWEVTDTQATVPLTGGEQGFRVRARYAAGLGDFSNEALVDAVLPVVDPLDPGSAWGGETVRVRLSGEYLLLVDGEVEVDLGAGIDIASVDVRSVDEAWVELEIDPSAVAGSRDLVLETGGLTLREEGAFTVLAAEDRPRLVGIEPASVRQGDEGELTITFTGALAGVPTVDLGEGVVTSEVTLGDGALTVTYVVTGDAPLGMHAVTADDGVRVLSGTDLEVKDAWSPAARTCGTPAPSGVALLGLLALLGRRRR